jgi:hypothetical protein
MGDNVNISLKHSSVRNDMFTSQPQTRRLSTVHMKSRSSSAISTALRRPSRNESEKKVS